jgi:ATP-dependent RNA helicase RhlB
VKFSVCKKCVTGLWHKRNILLQVCTGLHLQCGDPFDVGGRIMPSSLSFVRPYNYFESPEIMSSPKWFPRVWGVFKKLPSIALSFFSRSPIEPDMPAPRAAVTDIATGRDFPSFDLAPQIVGGLGEAGFHRCTEIQERTLPLSLRGRDIAAQAQTGSGKTAAFLITIFQRLMSSAPKKAYKAPRALVLAPTRELALQIYRDAQLLGKQTDLRFSVIYGGVSYRSQLDDLTAGVDVIVATPGRLIDYIKQKSVDLQRISILVIDEADRMLDMGFIADLRYILRRLPPYQRRQSMLFSATLSARVLELTYEYMNAPEEITANPEKPVVETVEQRLYHVSREDKLSLLLGLLRHEPWERVLIFANTKSTVTRLAERLLQNGFAAKGLTGDLTQKQRTQIMTQYRQGKIPILVATDVASRGLHVEDISHVINYDIPQDREEYVHRIGRTARAGKTGKAITLACEQYVYYLEPIEELLGQKIPLAWADDSWFYAVSGQPSRVKAGSRQAAARPPRGSRKGRGPKHGLKQPETLTKESEKSVGLSSGQRVGDPKRRHRRP